MHSLYTNTNKIVYSSNSQNVNNNSSRKKILGVQIHLELPRNLLKVSVNRQSLGFMGKKSINVDIK